MTVLMALGSFLPACKEDGPHIEQQQLGVMWMQWSAQVQEGQPVRVLIVGDLGCSGEYVRHYEIDHNNHTILFNPYKLWEPERECVLGIVPELFADSIDVLGLQAGTYQLQSSDRTFGEVVVTPTPPDAPPLIGAGSATFVRDPDDCLRIRPALTSFGLTLPLQDQADTTTSWSMAFVSGHILDTASPVCGVTRVFHLLSRQ